MVDHQGVPTYYIPCSSEIFLQVLNFAIFPNHKIRKKKNRNNEVNHPLSKRTENPQNSQYRLVAVQYLTKWGLHLTWTERRIQWGQSQGRMASIGGKAHQRWTFPCWRSSTESTLREEPKADGGTMTFRKTLSGYCDRNPSFDSVHHLWTSILTQARTYTHTRIPTHAHKHTHAHARQMNNVTDMDHQASHWGDTARLQAKMA